MSLFFSTAWLLAWRLVIFASGAFSFASGDWAQRRRVYPEALPRQQLARELATAAKLVCVDAALVCLALQSGWIVFAGAGAASFVASFVLLFLWYEVWFYGVHRALHSDVLFPLHALHHSSRVTTPLTASLFSVSERLALQTGAFLGAFVLGGVMPLSRPGFLVYFTFNYALNVLGHLNVEVYPRDFPSRWLGRVWTTPSYHAMHHHHGRGNYGLLTQVLDRWLGTYLAHWPEVFARATAPRAASLPRTPKQGLWQRFVGDLPRFRNERLRLLTDTLALGELVLLELGPKRVLLVNSPEAVQHVLVDHTDNYDKHTPAYLEAKQILGDGLFTSEGALWKQQRAKLLPVFHRSHMPSLCDTMTAVIRTRVDGLGSGGEVDPTQLMTELTVSVLGATVVGVDTGPYADALFRCFPALADALSERIMLGVPLPLGVPTRANRRLVHARRELIRVVEAIIAARSQAHGKNMLDLMKGEDMDPRLLRDEIMTMLLAGHETTAASIVWMLYLLDRHPEHKARVIAEVRAAAAPIGYDTLRALPYLQQCLSETIRLLPPLWAYSRRAVRADVVAGYFVPQGTIMLMCPYTMHRNERYWPDPERFDPERFGPAKPDRPKLAYIPYGAGERTCLGAHFAHVEACMVVAHLLAAYDVSFPGDQPLELATAFSLRPKRPLRMRLVKRT